MGNNKQHVSLVTGGAGFIGSHLVDHLVAEGQRVIVVDKLTYAGRRDNLSKAEAGGNVTFVHGDICNGEMIYDVLSAHDVTTIYHLAAESHVDNSINEAEPFIQTNVVGTYSMLSAALKYWKNKKRFVSFRFVHVSTDEVFGHLGKTDHPFTETTPYAPRSPYSASKAGSDHLATAWHSTYGLPVIISNCSNNYGTRQDKEKLIPVIIRNALAGDDIPIYGDGTNIRDWLHVDDHCRGLILAATKGTAGQSYCFGGSNEHQNINLAKQICTILDQNMPLKDQKSYADQLRFVTDRKGHDMRYAIDFSKAKDKLSYTPQTGFGKGLQDVVAYYINLFDDIKCDDTAVDLENCESIDLAATPLNYEGFRKLAQNKNLTQEERIGFPVEYRRGFEKQIVMDVTEKLDGLTKEGGSLLDIGCGASPLTDAFLDVFDEKKLDVTLNDSEEMLAHINGHDHCKKVVGLYPDNLRDVLNIKPEGYDYILCYSVLHYIYVDSNIFDFVDSIMETLAVGGVALIGDIPNISKRKRFFSSETGVAFHQDFMGTTERPTVDHMQVERDQIDDAVLQAMVMRAQAAGCDAYILPQGRGLPMQNRRDDLIIRRP